MVCAMAKRKRDWGCEENLSGKERRKEGWDNGRKGRRMWEPRQSHGGKKNSEEEGVVRGPVCCGRWLSKTDNKEGKKDSFKPSQHPHSEPWVILLLYFNGLPLFSPFSLTALVVLFRWERKMVIVNLGRKKKPHTQGKITRRQHKDALTFS